MAKRLAAAVELGKRRMKTLTAEERKELARAGGVAGGKARAQALSAKRRSEIAKKAAAARWKDKKSAPKG
jgi:hypothetical protein